MQPMLFKDSANFAEYKIKCSKFYFYSQNAAYLI